jgi:hypothetical protein
MAVATAYKHAFLPYAELKAEMGNYNVVENRPGSIGVMVDKKCFASGGEYVTSLL